jgi:ABC-2 type transport system ATP-binding protein
MNWVLEMSGLQGRENSLTRELAGGWKQRLALGCAILHEPQIVFLDEPTGGVDPLSRRRFWELINALSQAGATVFVTTHYLDEAEYCGNLMLIHRGKLIAGGSPRELKSKYLQNPVLEMECENVVDALEILQKHSWIKDASLFGSYLHIGVEDEYEGKRLIERSLAENNIGIKRIDLISPSLEDVFLHLVEEAS